jgi:chitinase
MWHAKNLEKGIKGSYLANYGLENATLTGTYTRHFDSTLVAPWLWNAEKKVFLSTEDEQSITAKADWVIKNGVGGVMFWEMAGDYDWYPERNNGQGEYYIGSTLTRLLHSKFVNTTPYGNTNSSTPMPVDKIDAEVSITGFKLGDQNYPINPTVLVKNNSNLTIKGGSVIEFDVPTSTSAQFGSWSGDQVSVVKVGHSGNNIGGLKGDFHRVAVTLPSHKSIEPGATGEFNIVYYLPISGPANYTITIDGKKYTVGTTTSTTPTDPTTPTEPTDPTTPSEPTNPPATCSAAAWSSSTVYTGGQEVSHNGHIWSAKWWTQGEEPGKAGVWADKGSCN